MQISDYLSRNRLPIRSRLINFMRRTPEGQTLNVLINRLGKGASRAEAASILQTMLEEGLITATPQQHPSNQTESLLIKLKPQKATQ
jgi:hypothetical protein